MYETLATVSSPTTGGAVAGAGFDRHSRERELISDSPSEQWDAWLAEEEKRMALRLIYPSYQQLDRNTVQTVFSLEP